MSPPPSAGLLPFAIKDALQRITGEVRLEKSELSEYYLRQIEKVTLIMKNEDTLLKLSGRFIIVGDIHGHLDSLLTIFFRFGFPDSSRIKYIFLGDYVDRGSNSLETIALLYSIKAVYPESIYLIRGNHEEARICARYGFEAECNSKGMEKVYAAAVESFEYLPLAAVLNSSVFCVHGGITRDLKLIDEIDNIKRPISLRPEIGLAYELCWNDPMESVSAFSENETRKAGYVFGPEPVKSFLSVNHLDYIVRAHQECRSGFEYPFGQAVPIITLFSANNYCGMRNRAAVMICPESLNLKIEPLCDSLSNPLLAANLSALVCTHKMEDLLRQNV